MAQLVLNVVLLQVQEANWELYKHQRAADGDLYGKITAAEAQKANAEASAFAKEQAADSDLYAKKKEAEGINCNSQSRKRIFKHTHEAIGRELFGS